MTTLFKNTKVLLSDKDSFKVLENAYLGIDEEKIDYIGLTKPVKQYDVEKDMYNKLLMPGLVNSHTHSAMNLLKGIGSDLPLNKWLETVWAVEDRMRDEDHLVGMEMAVLEMLAGGTTSFNDMYMSPFFTYTCIGESGIKANLTRVIMGGSDETDYQKFINRIQALELYHNCNGLYNDRLHIDWSVHAEYTIAEKIAQLWSEEIQKLGGRLHIHLSETQKEQQECISRHGITPAKWFEKLGLFNIPTYAAHCVWVTDEDIEVLKSHNVVPVHCPTSNLKLGSGFAPIPKMIENGLTVALGTDGSASNNNLNMFEEMHLASVIHNGVLRDSALMPPEQIVKMATINGAKTQGRFDTGSIEVGKKADIIAINLDAPHMVPDNDTLALIVYSAQASDVCMTMVDGKILYENGEFKTMDKERVFYNFKKSCEFLR